MCVNVCARECVNVHVRTRVCACMCGHLSVYVCVCVCAHARAYVVTLDSNLASLVVFSCRTQFRARMTLACFG